MSDDRVVLSGVLCLKGSLPNESYFTVPWGELFTKQGCLDFVDYSFFAYTSHNSTVLLSNTSATTCGALQ